MAAILDPYLEESDACLRHATDSPVKHKWKKEYWFTSSHILSIIYCYQSLVSSELARVLCS